MNNRLKRLGFIKDKNGNWVEPAPPSNKTQQEPIVMKSTQKSISTDKVYK
jgi:hypothetical protein